MENEKPSLDRMRNLLNPQQRELLEHTWCHFKEKGEWPVLREIFSKHGKEEVRKALISLGGGIGYEVRASSGWSRYELSTAGILITEKGVDMQHLLAMFFEFQRDLYRSDPLKTSASSQEVADFLKLNTEKTAVLGMLLFRRGASGTYRPDNKSEWTVNTMPEAENFPKDGALLVEAESWALRFYQAGDPVFLEDRDRKPYFGISNARAVGVDRNVSEPYLTPPHEITNSLIKLRQEFPDLTKLGFLMMRFDNDETLHQIVEAIKNVGQEYGLAVVRADDRHFHANLYENIITLLHGCGFGIAVYERIATEQQNPNVGFEVGYLMAMNKPVLLLKDKTMSALPADLIGKLYRGFDVRDPQNSIPEQMTAWLRDNGLIVPTQP